MIFPDLANTLTVIALGVFCAFCALVSLCQRLLGLPRLHPLTPSDPEPNPLDLIFGPDWLVLYQR